MRRSARVADHRLHAMLIVLPSRFSYRRVTTSGSQRSKSPLHHRLTNASIVNARSGNALRMALSAVTKGTDSALASATNSAS